MYEHLRLKQVIHNPKHKTYICKDLDLAVVTIPKIGMISTSRILSKHSQFEMIHITQLAKDLPSRVIRFNRPIHHRVLSFYHMIKEEPSFKLEWFELFIDWLEDNYIENMHSYPPIEWCTIDGVYLPTEEHLLKDIHKVFDSIDVTPKLEHLHYHAGEYDSSNWENYYTPELWDRVTKIYPNEMING
jgi:hypothetical protein